MKRRRFCSSALRMASMMPFTPSPGRPKIVSTPQSVNVSIRISAVVGTRVSPSRTDAFRPRPLDTARAASATKELARLAQHADGVLQRLILSLVIVLGVEIVDLRAGQVQLRLRQFDDGGEAQI